MRDAYCLVEIELPGELGYAEGGVMRSEEDEV